MGDDCTEAEKAAQHHAIRRSEQIYGCALPGPVQALVKSAGEDARIRQDAWPDGRMAGRDGDDTAQGRGKPGRCCEWAPTERSEGAGDQERPPDVRAADGAGADAACTDQRTGRGVV